MENRNITTKIIVCSYDELNEEEKKLIDAAKEATNRSYSPYSRFQVGAAALLSGGTVITGSNQENAAYPSGICAERKQRSLRKNPTGQTRRSGCNSARRRSAPPPPARHTG